MCRQGHRRVLASPVKRPCARKSCRAVSGHSLVELLLVVPILLTILAIALPRVVAARRTAQQASAVTFLRNLQAAQTQFYFARGHYAGTFAELQGFLAAEGGQLVPPGLQPEPIGSGIMPMLAFLLLPAPAPPDEPAFSSNGSSRPTGTGRESSGGGAPLGDAPSSGSSNPAPGNSDGTGPVGNRGPGSGSEEDSVGHGDPGSGSGSGETHGGNRTKADRLTWQSYEFYLLRPTPHSWNCLAMPVRDEQASYHYFADQTGAIRRELGRPAGAKSPAL